MIDIETFDSSFGYVVLYWIGHLGVSQRTVFEKVMGRDPLMQFSARGFPGAPPQFLMGVKPPKNSVYG